MKKTLLLALVALVMGAMVHAGPGSSKAWSTTIQEGIQYSGGHFLVGQDIPLGFHPYGYNYQAHMFKGYYANVYLGGNNFPAYQGDTQAYLEDNPAAASKWYWPYRDTQLLMKWNDAWLSNQDRNGDGKLDRYYGYDSYIGSGAWETNHMWGSDADGNKYNDFVKISAVPTDAEMQGDYWYLDGQEIGSEIWGQFALTMEVYNDQETGDHGVLYKGDHPGFGFYK